MTLPASGHRRARPGMAATAALRSAPSAAAAPLAGLALALVAAGCAKKRPPPPPPPTVMAAHPLKREIADWDDYEGRFEAVDSVDVRPRVSGYIQAIAFKDGEDVRAGQLLFQIDPRPYQAILDQARAQVVRAEATLANAQLEAARAEQLFQAKAISQQELATREATLQQSKADLLAAQATVRQAALNLAFTRVTAPLAGRVSDRKYAVGNLVTADTTVLTSIVNLDPIRFLFEGGEDVYLKYQRLNREGGRPSSRTRPNPVEIRLQDEAEYRWKGRMDFVDNVLDPSSGTIRGRAVIANPDRFLTPGMFGHMRLLGSTPYVGLLLPDTAVSSDQSREIVDVVGRDGKLAERVVQMGPTVDGLRVVRSGITADDFVVVAGMQKTKAGAKVRMKEIAITPPDKGAAPAPYLLPPASSAQSAG